MNGPEWVQCADMRDTPCLCAFASRFVRCTLAPAPGGRRELAAQFVLRLATIALPSNNVTGYVPTLGGMDLLSSLDLSSNNASIVGPANVLKSLGTCLNIPVCVASAVCTFGGATALALCTGAPTSRPTQSQAPTLQPSAAAVAAGAPPPSSGPTAIIAGAAAAAALLLLAVPAAFYLLVVRPRRRERERKLDLFKKQHSSARFALPGAEADAPAVALEDAPAGSSRRLLKLGGGSARFLALGDAAADKPVKPRTNILSRVMALIKDDRAQHARALNPKIDFKALSDYVIANDPVFELLLDAEPKAFASENILFWKALDRFERFESLQRNDPKQYASMANQIIVEFVKQGARSPVQLAHHVRLELERLNERSKAGEAVFTRSTFAEAKRDVAVVLMVAFLAYFKRDIGTAETLMLNAVTTIDDALGDDDVVGQDTDKNVATLMGLGYSRMEAIEALRKHRNNVEAAATELLTAAYEA